MGFHGIYTRLPASVSTQKEADSFKVIIHSSHEFGPTDTNHVSGCGRFSSDFIDVVQALKAESSLTLQASCTVCSTSPQALKAQAKAARFGPVSLPCEVSIILYGPKGLVDNVGEFFQDLDMYLQDPNGCDWNVTYCNPHRLSSLNIDDCPMTSELSRPGIEVEFDHTLFQSIPGETDILEVLDAHQDLPEASQPELVLAVLKRYVKNFPGPVLTLSQSINGNCRHQKQALTFLRQREAGWDFDPGSLDFWDFRQTSQQAL